MVLTKRQQGIVNSLPPSQRRAKSQFFLRQNANNQRVIATPQRRQTQQPRIQRSINNQSGQTFSGTTVLVAYTVPNNDNKFNAEELDLNPANIPSLEPISKVFEQWKYTRLSIVYTPSVPNTVTGHILYAIVPVSHTLPTTETAFFAIQNQRTTSVHTTAPAITASNIHSGSWFYNAKGTGLTTPLKVLIGSHSVPKNTAAGIFLISYTLSFRGQS